MMLGAYAMADTHTLCHDAIMEMSQGAISEDAVRIGLEELASSELVQKQPDGGYRLTKEGISLTLHLQEVLAKQSPDSS